MNSGRVIFATMVLLLASAFLAHGAGKRRPKAQHLFSTWENMEADKCASAWLIKRFVDKKAEFKFFPRGELISEGTPFDTPDAELRRYHRTSTFETILKKYKIKDKELERIGKLIHEIEVNYWTRRWSKQAKRLRSDLLNIIEESKEPEACFARSFKYFDELYRNMKAEKSKKGRE